MIKKASLLIIFLYTAIAAYSVNLQQVRFHNEASDTIRINEILAKAKDAKLQSTPALVGFIGREFIGTPYVAHTLEGEEEMLTVNLDELDCTTFVETVAALAMTVNEGRTSWRDFIYNLERLRYRNGEMDGYPSRLHYICDWVMDNTHKGILQDVSTTFPGSTHTVKTMDFMSSNRDKYAALADSANFARIKNIEDAYSNHRYPFVKSRFLNNKNVMECFMDGDIVALTSSLKNLDVTHMGIVVREEDGKPHLLHASSSNGKVEITQATLGEFMKRNRSLTGVRVIRMK